MIGDRTRKGRYEVEGPPLVTLVSGGNVVLWEGDTAYIVLTAVDTYTESDGIDQTELAEYKLARSEAVKEKDPDRMRDVISHFSHLIPQSEELLGVSDHILIQAARIFTEAIGVD
jgi:hypothetical protein